MTVLADLLAWHAASDRAVLTAAGATPGLPSRAWQTAGHLAATPLVWLARLTPSDPPEVWPYTTPADLPALLTQAERAHRGWTALLGRIDLDAPVAYRSTSGAEHQTAPRAVALHVVTHGAYHRGQLNAAIRSAGGAPVAQDYIYHVR